MKTAFCFDLDGTITKDEILPILSQKIGLYEEIGALTDATIRGIIPFRKSFLLRCRLMRDIPIDEIHNAVSTLRLFNKIVDFINNNSGNCFVVTGNLDCWITPLREMIKCKFYSSEAIVEKNIIKEVSCVLNKDDAVKDIRKSFSRIISIGDGMGDVHMFAQSDVCIAFGGTHEPISTLQEMSHFLTFSEKSLCALLKTLS